VRAMLCAIVGRYQFRNYVGILTYLCKTLTNVTVQDSDCGFSNYAIIDCRLLQWEG